MAWRFGLLFIAAATVLRGDAEADVRAAVQAWREASGYAWESTARATESHSLAPNAPRATPRAPKPTVRGKSEAEGLTEIVLLPKAANQPSALAYIKSSIAAVADTPIGWLTRQEMRDAPQTHRDRTVTVDGKSIRLYRFLSLGIDASNVQTPIEDVLTLLADIRSYEELQPGEIAGELKPMAAQMLLGASRSRRPDAEFVGRVIFRLRNGLPEEYEVRFETTVPPGGNRPGSRSVTWWKTTLSGFGTTKVNAPPGAVEKLATLR